MDKIAIIRLSSLGDIILTEPVTRSLKHNFPNSRITFFTRESYRPVVEMFPAVDKIESFLIPGPDQSLDGLNSYLESIGLDYDLVIDLHKNLRSKIISRKLKSENIITYQKDRIQRQLAVWFKFKKLSKTSSEKYLETLSKLEIPVTSHIPELKIDQSQVKLAEKYLQDINFDNNKFAILAVGASHAPKKYPLKKYAELAQLLSEKYNLKSLVVDDSEIADQHVFDKVKQNGIVEFGIGLDLKLLSVIISMARVTISNDSGLMHLSSALQTPTIGLFGPTHPILGFQPMGGHSVALTTDEKCSPCSLHGKRPCHKKEQFCFTNLTTNMIVKTVEDSLR